MRNVGLEDIKVKGAGKLSFQGFEQDEMEIDLIGAIEAEGEVSAKNLTIDLTGASSLELKGSGGFLEATATGASSIKAYNYEVKEAIVEARGASSARVFVTEKLEITKGIASSVSHRGEPQVIERN